MSDDLKRTLDRLNKAKELLTQELEKAPRDDDSDVGMDEDAAAKWLKEQESAGAEPEASAESSDEKEEQPLTGGIKRSRSYVEWQPRGDYSPEEKSKIDKLISDGYSHREAERMSGAHKGPKSFDQALQHNIKPSMPSDKHLEELRGLASEWLDNHDRYEKMSADAAKNPVKHAAGKMLSAHEDRVKNYHDAYSKHLNSDEVKDLKGLARHKKIQEWKEKYRQENPEYDSSISDVSEAQRSFKDASEARKQTLGDMMDHITRGGVSMPSETSYQEAAQSIGGEKNEDSGYVTTTQSDPAAAFAAKNKEYTQHLANVRKIANQEQLDRMQRVNNAKTAQEPAKPSAPAVIRRRPAKPEGSGDAN